MMNENKNNQIIELSIILPTYNESSTIEKMLNEKATWNSFSGSLKKLEKDKVVKQFIISQFYKFFYCFFSW